MTGPDQFFAHLGRMTDGQRAELYPRFMSTLTSSLITFGESHMGEAAKAALRIAERYWSGHAAPTELQNARTPYWRELDVLERGTRSWRVTRAVACTLYPELDVDELEDIWQLYVGLLVSETDLVASVVANLSAHLGRYVSRGAYR